MPQNDPDHNELRALGSRLDKVRQRDGARKIQPPPTSLGMAFRFATELFAALIVGAAMGWGLDRLFGVTMAERGVSQLVSVTLAEAERVAAAE